MDPELFRVNRLLQSYFDKVSTLARESKDGKITAARFAERVQELTEQYDKALRGEK